MQNYLKQIKTEKLIVDRIKPKQIFNMSDICFWFDIYIITSDLFYWRNDYSAPSSFNLIYFLLYLFIYKLVKICQSLF